MRLRHSLRYDTFVLFKRAFNPVHVIAISIRHRGDNLVVASMAKRRLLCPSDKRRGTAAPS
jgi:hypothetical protein